MNTEEINDFIKENQAEFSKLNEKQQDLLKNALLEERKLAEYEKWWRKLLLDVDFPVLDDPAADLDGRNLNEVQRTVALLAYHSEHRYLYCGSRRMESECSIQFALPHRESILRWLGLEEQGILEETIDFKHEGKTLHIPTWRAFQLTEEDRNYDDFLNTFPVNKQISIIIELIEFYHSHSSDDMYDIPLGFPITQEFLKRINGEFNEWATSHIQMLIDKKKYAENSEWNFIFQCLLKAGVEIKPEWENFIPEYNFVNIIDFFPEERKEHLIKLILPKFTYPDYIVKGATDLLKKYPCQTLIDGIAEHYDKCRKPARIILKNVIDATEEGSVWQEKIKEILQKMPKIQELYVLENIKPKKIEDIKNHHIPQLEIAMNKWEGDELSLQEWFDHENEEVRAPDNVDEILVLCDNKGKPVVDIHLVGCDSGAIFEAGTTNELGYIIQDSMKMRKRKLKEAIVYAMFARDEYKKN